LETRWDSSASYFVPLQATGRNDTLRTGFFNAEEGTPSYSRSFDYATTPNGSVPLQATGQDDIIMSLRDETAARSAAVLSPFVNFVDAVAPPVKATGGLVIVRLCIEADYSRKAKQRTVLFGEYLARPFKS